MSNQQGLFRPWLAPPRDRGIGTETQSFLTWVQTSLNALISQQPPSVSGVTAQRQVGGVKVNWPEAVGASNYIVYENGSPLGSQAALPNNQGVNSFTHAGLSDTKTRAYQVQAVTRTGLGGPLSQPVAASAATPLHSALAPPTMDQTTDGPGAYFHVASVSTSHQVTTPSIQPGAASALGTQPSTPSTPVAVGTTEQVASISFTPNGGTVTLSFNAPVSIVQAMTVSIYRGTVSGTLLGSQTYSQTGIVSIVAADASAPTVSQQYTAYVENLGATNMTVGPGAFVAQNAKV